MRFRHRISLAISLAISLVGAGISCGGSESAPTVDAAAPPSTPINVDAGKADDRTDASTPDASSAAPTLGPLALAQLVEQARYTTDITFVAQSREPGTEHWQAVQDLCATRFAALGFAVERYNYGTGVNVIGVRPGTTDAPKRIVLGAHYDSVPNCPGADDNASGVAGVLEAARVLAMVSSPKTLVVACWDEEERGLIGSKAHAKRAAENKDQIEAVFDLEMIAYKNDAENSQQMPLGFGLFFPEATTFNDANKKRANFIGAGGDPKSAPSVSTLRLYAEKINLPFMSLLLKESDMNNPLLGDLKRSDHASFWANGYPAMMITDTSNFRYSAYHCLKDQVDELKNIDLGFATHVTQMVVGATAEALGVVRDF